VTNRYFLVPSIDSCTFACFLKSISYFSANKALAWSDEIDPRLYSIASGKNDKNIQLIFNVVNDGALTPKLASIKPGDKLLASKAFGKFVCGEGPACWIAAGTGIAPFSSMLRSGMGNDKILIHGGKFDESFYYSNEFEPELKENYIRCSSQQKVDGAYHGRSTTTGRRGISLITVMKLY